MNIVICDDDEHYHSLLNKKLQTYLKEKDIECSINHYYSGESLLDSNINSTDLIFLDIRMNELDGLEVAHILRRKKMNFTLIFISSYIEYAPYGYETNALRYMLKEHLNTLFEPMMDAVLKDLGYFQRILTPNFAYGSETIYAEDILYLESKLHTVYFYFIKRKEARHLYGKLDDIQNLLSKTYSSNLLFINFICNYCCIRLF